MSKEELEFLLRITDYFHGHWEDPGWGSKYMNQVLVLLGAHTWANGIAETEARQAVQHTIEKAMTDVARKVMSTPDPVPPVQKK